MAVHAAHAHHSLLHDHLTLVSHVTRVATGLLAVACTVALGAAWTDEAVLAIRVLTPVAFLGAMALALDHEG